MNNPSLIALTVAAPVPASSVGLGDSAFSSNSEGSNAFSQLLDPGAAGAPDTAPVLAATPPAATNRIENAEPASADEDAPWPPAGLESLLGSTDRAESTETVDPSAILSAGTTPLQPASVPVAMTLGAAVSDAGTDTLTGTGKQAASAAGDKATAITAGMTGLRTSQNAALGQATPSVHMGNFTLPEAMPAAAELTAAAKTALTLDLAPDSAPPSSFGLHLQGMTPTSATSLVNAALETAPTALQLASAQPEQEVADGIQWMIDHKLQSARIRVTPDQMGTIDVEIRLEGDRLHAHFTAAQAEVRHVLNDSLPRLRELLDASGLRLGDTGVSDQQAHPDQAANASHDGTGSAAGTTAGAGDAGSDTTVPLRMISRGLLDTYA